MEVDLIFRIAAIGIIVSVLYQVLLRSGREEQAMLTSLAGLIVVLTMLIYEISGLLIPSRKYLGWWYYGNYRFDRSVYYHSTAGAFAAGATAGVCYAAFLGVWALCAAVSVGANEGHLFRLGGYSIRTFRTK